MEGVRFVPNGTEGELIMDGTLTIENAAEIRTAVYDALVSTERLILTIGEGAGVDIALLQILCSAHRSALESDKGLTIRASDKSNFACVRADAGLTGYNCGIRVRDCGCLWIRGGSDE